MSREDVDVGEETDGLDDAILRAVGRRHLVLETSLPLEATGVVGEGPWFVLDDSDNGEAVDGDEIPAQ